MQNKSLLRVAPFVVLTLSLLVNDLLAQIATAEKKPPVTATKAEKPDTKVADKKSAKDAAKSKTEKTKSEGESKPTEKPKISVAEIKLGGSLSEGPTQLGLLTGTDNSSLMSMVKRLNKARDDNKVRSVLLRIKGAALGRGQLNEIREAISGVRKNGKMVYAQMEMGTPAEYLVACACDKIMMPESGILIVPGVRAEVTFYKNMLDKLNVKADMMQVGDFKGAAEPMTRNSMSEPFRKQLDSVLADYYNQMVNLIATDRSLGEDTVKELIDQAIFTADAAKEAGLIDIVDYEGAWDKELLAGSKDHELAMLEDYGKKKVDTDFSGMGGFLKMMEIFSGGKKSSRKSKQDKKIAVVYAVGAITSGASSNSPMGGQTMGSDTIVEALAKADDDEDVAAIVLRVDSPGGSALASDLIWNKIQEIEKPVIASMGNVAASGGYYISMGCDKILAEPGTLTGSIGVVGGKIVIGGLMDKVGITTDVIAYGKNSGMFSGSEPFSKESRELMKSYMDETYQQFTEKAAAGRGMKIEKLKSLAGGRVWTGLQAKENGLVDEIGTLREALKAAQKMAKLSTEEEPDLLILPEQKTFFEELFEGGSVAAPVGSSATAGLLPKEMQVIWSEVRTLERVFQEPAACILPYRIELK